MASLHLQVETDPPQAVPSQDAGSHKRIWFLQGMALAGLMLIGVAASGAWPTRSEPSGQAASVAFLPGVLPGMPTIGGQTGRQGRASAPRKSVVMQAPDPPKGAARSNVVLNAATATDTAKNDEIVVDFSEGQLVSPTMPAHAWEKPWTNLHKQENVQLIKASSQQLLEPLKSDMANDEIFVSDDSIHILKHHGSYMQQNRDLKGAEKKQSYQFMLRLKMPCGEVPGYVFQELDDLCTDYGQGDLRATTRQAFQLHGVVKKDLKGVVARIANIGSNTYGGCGDISRNVMTPPVHFPNDPAYVYCMQYARAMADLFKPMTEAFTYLWLDNEPALNTEYWQRDIQHFKLDEVRKEDRGNGIITGHPVEPLYGRTYLPKKFKIGMTVPGDNSIDIYINDIGAVVIMEPDGKTLKGFNIMVGGGMGRTHKKEATFARVADHLGFVDKDNFFEAMKAILAVTRDHGNREVRSNARLKYLVHTLGIDDFRVLTEKYFGQKFQPWEEMIDFKFLDWLGWHDQGDGKWMLGVNVEQGRISDTEEVKVKTALRKIVDAYGSTMTKEGVDLILTPAQSVVLRNIKPEDMLTIENLLIEHGIKSLEGTDRLSRKSMACPAFPLCGLAVTEAERVQPEINRRLVAQLDKMGLDELVIVQRTTGCPNGCARPYMAEMALVGSGKDMYQVWFGGHPEQVGRTGFAMPNLFKMKLSDLEVTMEPVFAMYKSQRLVEDEAFGDFTNRVGAEAIEAYMATYVPGSYDDMETDDVD